MRERVERIGSEQGGGFICLGVSRGTGRRLDLRRAGRSGRLGRRSLGGLCLRSFRRGGPGVFVRLPLLGNLVRERPARGDELAERAVRAARQFGIDLLGAGRDRDWPGLAAVERGRGATGFFEDQQAGGVVPQLLSAVKVDIESTGGEIAPFQRARTEIALRVVRRTHRQFVAEDLAVKVAETLREFALPGSALELEFTERVLIEDAPATLRTFAELRRMGVVLTIDDFGEGYSALNYLRRLPIHGLKLSPLFVGGVPENRSDVAVCQAVGGIARSLGLELVAEGVERESQRRYLLELGVPIGQGFLFAPGLPPDELGRRLAACGGRSVRQTRLATGLVGG